METLRSSTMELAQQFNTDKTVNGEQGFVEIKHDHIKLEPEWNDLQDDLSVHFTEKPVSKCIKAEPESMVLQNSNVVETKREDLLDSSIKIEHESSINTERDNTIFEVNEMDNTIYEEWKGNNEEKNIKVEDNDTRFRNQTWLKNEADNFLTEENEIDNFDYKESRRKNEEITIKSEENDASTSLDQRQNKYPKKVNRFRCDQCEYSTSRSGSLKYHRLTHTNPEKLKCNQCEYATITSGRRKFLNDDELRAILMNSDDETFDENENDVPTSDEDEVSDTEADLETLETEGDSEDDGPPDKILKPNEEFCWSNRIFQPIIHDYNPANSELKNTLDLNATAMTCFKQFFSETLIESIVNETNRYADLTFQTSANTSRQSRWKPTSSDELYVFFAVTLLMAQTKKRKINDYWSTDPLIATPMFSQIISRDRFILLLRNLHFADNKEQHNSNDRLFKIRTVVDHLKAAFQQSLHPGQNLCIDESSMLFKGRFRYKQYIPSKHRRFGIKFFVLCDCKTGYSLDFIIYTGSKTDIQEFKGNLGMGANIVLTLLERYMYNGHSIFLDNWYSSPKLFSVLHENKINACGKVRANRTDMPPLKKKLETGEVLHASTANMLALKWKDKRENTMLTTFHTADVVSCQNKRGIEVKKPACFLEYNKNMGAVDRSDMLYSSAETVRKSIKCYKKIFFHLLDMSTLNAHALYQLKTGKKLPLIDFQLQLVKQLLEEHKKMKTRYVGGRGNEDSPLRLIERHFPAVTEHRNEQNKLVPRRCTVCSKNRKRRETTFRCPKCDVALCVVPCFEQYHTLKNY